MTDAKSDGTKIAAAILTAAFTMKSASVTGGDDFHQKMIEIYRAMLHEVTNVSAR